MIMATAAGAAWSHPHVFVTNQMEVHFEGENLSGIAFRWTFDAVFSAMILADHQPDIGGRFTAKQITAIKTGAFDNLAKFHYFLEFRVGDRKIERFTIQRFSAEVIESDTLVYSFFVPLNLAVKSAEQTLRLTLFDEAYSVAFTPVSLDELDVVSDGKIKVIPSVEKSDIRPLVPGQEVPRRLVIRFRGP
jgi:ABC-type uncharacterized transport system substrate-binding protein